MDKKGKGLISYLLGWLGGLIVLFAFKDNDRKTAFHACQAITLSLALVVIDIAFGIVGAFVPYVGYISSLASIVYLVFMIMGIVKAVNDEPDPKLPIIGDLTEKMFSNKINEFPETVTAAPQFDPNTGQPVNPQPQASFDPNTGQPINQQPEAKFDPNTGQPIGQSADAPAQPETPAETPAEEKPVETPAETPTETPAEEKPAEEAPTEENK